MTKEEFEQTLVNQYSAVIEELIVECESVYRSHIDYSEVDFRVRALLKSAKVDGVDEKVIWDLLQRRLPGYISYLTGAKIAA